MKFTVLFFLVITTNSILMAQKGNVAIGFGIGGTPLKATSDYRLGLGGLVGDWNIKYSINNKIDIGFIIEGAIINEQYSGIIYENRKDTSRNIVSGTNRIKNLLFADYYFLSSNLISGAFCRLGLGYVIADPVSSGTIDGINKIQFGKTDAFGAMIGIGMKLNRAINLTWEYNLFPKGNFYIYNENNVIVPNKIKQNYIVFKLGFNLNFKLPKFKKSK